MKLKTDSRKVTKGDTFVALKEEIGDGHQFIEDAIKNGAETVIVEKGLYSVETIVVNNTHDYLIEELDRLYHSELSSLNIIGITGTNGKTTSCYLLYQALNQLNIKCAYIGTFGFYKKEGKVRELSNTTPDIVELYDMLLDCVHEGYKCVAMEVSSHALDKKRIGKLLFDYAIFTNLTEDHLDYHQTMETYLHAKLKLFNHLKENGKRIVNYDDPYAKYFIDQKTRTYGMTKQADYCFEVGKTTIKNSEFQVKHLDQVINYQTTLIGEYNIYNLVSIMIVLDELNQLNQEMINKLKPPRGRMEKIPYGNSMIIIDYAHTPDATLHILQTVSKLGANHIYTILGCGGNRDAFKRPIMADIATTYSDEVIFTSDNPRDEEPSLILKDMTEGLKQNNYIVEENRELAIKKGILRCQDNDILLILGKGHENYQLIKGIKYDFDDTEMVIKYISTT